jgi:hypothetical protein
MDDPQVGALDRLEQLTARLDHARRRERLGDFPVRVRAARAARLDQQVAGTLGQERPQRVQLAGLVDVDPQPAGLADRVLLPARRRADGGGEEHLLAPLGMLRGELEQRFEPPLFTGGAAEQEVVGSPACGDLKTAITPRASRQLDEAVALLVQQPDLN